MSNAQKLAIAVTTLSEFTTEPIANKRDIAGILQGFSFCFELAWKALQDEVARRGYSERGPRPVLQAAFNAELISDIEAEVWAQMMEDRNLVAHTYRPEWATELVIRIKDQHLPALAAVSERLNALTE